MLNSAIGIQLAIMKSRLPLLLQEGNTEMIPTVMKLILNIRLHQQLLFSQGICSILWKVKTY